MLASTRETQKPDPELEDRTKGTPARGGRFTFKVEATDPWGIEGAWLIYMFGDGEVKNVSMKRVGTSNVYSATVSVPEDVEGRQVVFYKFKVQDTGGNWYDTEQAERELGTGIFGGIPIPYLLVPVGLVAVAAILLVLVRKKRTGKGNGKGDGEGGGEASSPAGAGDDVVIKVK